MFGEDIFQRDWKSIAKDVKYFCSEYTNAGYIDSNNDLYVVGNDSKTLGLGEASSISKMITNYTKVTDSNIAGKAKEVYFGQNNTYVLDINGGLWATGLVYNEAGTANIAGWEGNDNKTTYVKLLDNIEYFVSHGSKRIAIDNTGKVNAWGDNIGGQLGFTQGSKRTLNTFNEHTYNLPEEIISATKPNNILELSTVGWQRSFIVTKDGNLYRSGNWNNGAYDGGVTSYQYFSKFAHKNMNLESDEKIISCKSIGDTTTLILTDKGNLFGYGVRQLLGVNKTNSEYLETNLIAIYNDAGEKEKIVQISAGNGFFVVVTESGKVFGTGNNSNGVLGRWLGGDKISPNSRYKTAFTWVECPELEL